MFVYSLSRKQCGVIYANIKSGKISVNEKFVSWMYNRIADARVFSDNAVMVDVFTKMKNGLQAIFDDDFEIANKDLNLAFASYSVRYTD